MRLPQLRSRSLQKPGSLLGPWDSDWSQKKCRWLDDENLSTNTRPVGHPSNGRNRASPGKIRRSSTGLTSDRFFQQKWRSSTHSIVSQQCQRRNTGRRKAWAYHLQGSHRGTAGQRLVPARRRGPVPVSAGGLAAWEATRRVELTVNAHLPALMEMSGWTTDMAMDELGEDVAGEA